MDQRSQYLIQILEKIGAPLLGAVADVSARQEKAAPTARNQDELARGDAQRVAELLAKAIQVSIDLGKSMDLASMPDQGESLRLALAAVAGDIVAGQYRTLARVPAEADIRRAITALEAVLTFSENFIPSPENIARLQEIKAQGVVADASQTIVQSMQAFLPVVNAIGAFPFGQPEQKLIQDISERLLSVMYELTQKIFGNTLNETSRPFAELAILRSLAQIYADSHIGEMNRLMSMGEETRMQQPLTLDPVWAAFDARVAMLEVLSLSLAAGEQGKAGGSGGKAPAAPVQQVTTPPVTPVMPPVTPITPPPAQAAAPPAGANPMSMFAKPGGTQTAAPPTAPTMPPAQPPAPPAESAPPSQQPPASSPPSQGGGPMSFFKKPQE